MSLSAQRALGLIRQHSSGFAHGRVQERREAAAAFASVAAEGGSVGCEALLREVGARRLVDTMSSASDEQSVLYMLIVMQHVALHFPSQLCDAGIAWPIVVVLEAHSLPMIIHEQAVVCAEALCEDEDAGAALLAVGLAPALLRLAIAVRRRSGHALVLIAVRVIARLAEVQRQTDDLHTISVRPPYDLSTISL